MKQAAPIRVRQKMGRPCRDPETVRSSRVVTFVTKSELTKLERIAVPTLVLESAGAELMDRTRSSAEFARLPASELVQIDATHWPLTERPDEVRRAI